MSEHCEGTDAFLAIYPTILRHAHFAFRTVRDPASFDDRVQETLAICWRWCCRLCRQGKDPRDFPTALATFATRQVRSGRSFVGRKTYRNDVLSPHAQTVRGFCTQALPTDESRTSPPWRLALEDNTVSPVPVQVAFRIDFPAWLDSLSGRKRRIALALAGGESTQDLAAAEHLSPGRISQLRRELCADWHAFTAVWPRKSRPRHLAPSCVAPLPERP